jgi:hypothetical protein
MPHRSETRDDDVLEAYLDGLLDDAQREAFHQRLRDDPQLQRQVDLQARIDGALGRLFHVEAPSHEQLSAALAAAVGSAGTSLPTVALRTPAESVASTLPPTATRRSFGARLYWAAAGLAAAAAIAWVLATLTGGPPANNQPQFVVRPLAQIYQAAVAAGFEPSYDCRDPELFARTFQKRQGQPLRLLAMPPGTRMLGLAYTGGLSRQTTAMLGLVDGQPVMTFIDRADADQKIAADVGDSALHVFRQERDGLVFYEVTPLDEPRMLELFAPATLEGRPLDSPATPDEAA